MKKIEDNNNIEREIEDNEDTEDDNISISSTSSTSTLRPWLNTRPSREEPLVLNSSILEERDKLGSSFIGSTNPIVRET